MLRWARARRPSTARTDRSDGPQLDIDLRALMLRRARARRPSTARTDRLDGPQLDIDLRALMLRQARARRPSTHRSESVDVAPGSGAEAIDGPDGPLGRPAAGYRDGVPDPASGGPPPQVAVQSRCSLAPAASDALAPPGGLFAPRRPLALPRPLHAGDDTAPL
eukprot:1188374-Prorocentrum_minimum.AAC.8